MRRLGVLLAAAVVGSSLLIPAARGSIACSPFTRLVFKDPHGYADGIAINDGDTTTVGRKIMAQEYADIPGSGFLQTCWSVKYFNGPAGKPYIWKTQRIDWLKAGSNRNPEEWQQDTLPGRNVMQVHAGGLTASFTWYGA